LTLQQRLRRMAWGWGSVGLAYSLAGCLPGPGLALAETALDRAVPFDPRGVWLYLSFFLLVPAAYLFTDAARLTWLQRAMQACALVAGILFVAFPSTLVYPAVTGTGWSEAALRLLIAHDSARNCLPSLHAALTVLAALALLDPKRPWRSSAVLLWGCLILHSILQTRRHLAVDVSAGLMLGAMCAAWARSAATAGRRKEAVA
jgi:hypothetical protein